MASTSRKRICPIAATLLLLSISMAARSQTNDSTLLQIRTDAKTLEPLVHSRLARSWLGTVKDLQTITTRTVYRDETNKKYYSKSQGDKLDHTRRAALKEIKLDEGFYYYTKYGSPLAYVRPLEILGNNGLTSLQGKQILDFGY